MAETSVLTMTTPRSTSPRNVRTVRLGGVLEVLYSFDIPVAYEIVGGSIAEPPRVSGRTHSMTTQRHIREWLDGRPYKELDAEQFDRWLTEAVIDACHAVARRSGHGAPTL